MGICLQSNGPQVKRKSILLESMKNENRATCAEDKPPTYEERKKFIDFFSQHHTPHNSTAYNFMKAEMLLNKSLSPDTLLLLEKNDEPILKKRTKKSFSDSNINLPNFDSGEFLDSKIINIVIIGGKKVGKSAFLIKITKNYFEKFYIPTLFFETKMRKMLYKDKDYTINFIIPPANDEDDHNGIFEKAHFIFLFYDTSVKGSFEETKKMFFNQVNRHAKIFKNKITNFYFIGNKIDLNREEPQEKVEKFCKRHNFEFFEISVKTGSGVISLLNNILTKFEEIVS